MDILHNIWHAVISAPWWVDGCAAIFIAWVIFWNIQGWRLSHHSGYTAPRLTGAPQMVRWALASLVGRWFIGPLRIEGWENLAGIDGSVIVGPNHQLEADVWLVGMGLGRRYVRFLMAINQTAGFLRAPFFAWMGAISVGYDKTNPAGAAAESAVKAMTKEKNSRLLLFPQGSLIRDDKWDRKQFFRGLMKISRLVSADGQRVWLLPTVAQYNFDARYASTFQKLIDKLGISRKFFGHQIYGATICIGKPLLRSDLPEDDTAAMDVYYQAMLETRERCHAITAAAHGA